MLRIFRGHCRLRFYIIKLRCRDNHIIDVGIRLVLRVHVHKFGVLHRVNTEESVNEGVQNR